MVFTVRKPNLSQLFLGNLSRFLVRYDISFVAKVADKILFLDKGKIIESGTPDEIINHPKEERTKEFFASYKRAYI